jgi:hypothetical protein
VAGRVPYGSCWGVVVGAGTVGARASMRAASARTGLAARAARGDGHAATALGRRHADGAQRGSGEDARGLLVLSPGRAVRLFVPVVAKFRPHQGERGVLEAPECPDTLG